MQGRDSLLGRELKVIDAISRCQGDLRFSEISQQLDNPSPSSINKILIKDERGCYIPVRQMFLRGQYLHREHLYCIDGIQT